MKEKIDINHLDYFIDRFYQAVYSHNGIHDVIQELSNFIEAPYSAFQVENQYTHELRDFSLLGYDGNAIKSYGDYYVARDPWTIEGFKKGTINNEFVASQRIVDDKAYQNSEFYQDWGRKHGVRHAIGSGFSVSDGYFVKFSFQRHQDHRAFDERTEYFLNCLRPHLKNYVELNPVFHGHAFNEDSWEASLNCLNRPLWVVDRLGKLIFANKTGHEWIVKNRGLQLEREYLTPTAFECRPSFLSAVFEMSQAPKMRNGLINRATILYQGETENLWLSPLVLQDQHRPNFVMIVGREQSLNESELELLFSLTRRQSQVCSLLIKGDSVQEISTKLNISINTARNILYACFKKLGVSNQSELIIRLYSGIKM